MLTLARASSAVVGCQRQRGRCLAARRVVATSAFLEGQPGASAPKPKKESASKPAAAPKQAKPVPKKEPSLRAPTAYNLFYKASYPALKQTNPGIKLPEANQKLREQWERSPAEVRAPYEEEAAAKKAVVDAKKAEAAALKKANAKPLTAYMLFSSKNRAAVLASNPGTKVTEVAKLLGAQWKRLSPEQQQQYKDEAAELLAAWKAKQGPAAA